MLKVKNPIAKALKSPNLHQRRLPRKPPDDTAQLYDLETEKEQWLENQAKLKRQKELRELARIGLISDERLLDEY